MPIDANYEVAGVTYVFVASSPHHNLEIGAIESEIAGQ